MLDTCCLCGASITPTVRANPTCSTTCRTKRKQQRNTAYKATHLERLRAYDRAYHKQRNATLSKRQRIERRKRARAWRNGEGRAKLLVAKKRHRESAKGKATVRVYLSRPEVKEATRLRAHTYGKQWRQQARRERMRTDPEYRKRCLLRRLRKTPTHKAHARELKRQINRLAYWRDPDTARAKQQRLELNPKRAEARMRRRRAGALAFRTLVSLGIMPATYDRSRRLHTLALTAIKQMGVPMEELT